MKKLLVLTGILVALIVGFISYTTASAEKPYSDSTNNLSTPTDRVQLNQIQVNGNKLTLTFNKDLYLSEYAATKSMLPLFDKGHNGIEFIPETSRDIKIGDIVAYQSNIVPGLIVHRIIDINQDNEGIYFVSKGDNNQTIDPEKIRFSQVKFILIGVLY
jgi:hypothetical protein